MTPHYFQISPGKPLPSINQFAPFKAVVILNTDYSVDWQDQVSSWLVDSGCRYMLAWGPNCTTWDDSVDYAVIVKHPDVDETPDDKFVMTTWHDDQTLEDVFWQAQFVAILSYDDIELNEAILVDVSCTPRENEMQMLWERSKSLADRESNRA